MIPIQTTYLKPRTWTKYLFLLTPAIMITLYYVEGSKDDAFLYIGLGSLVIFLIAAWLLSKVYVMIDNDGISYKTAISIKTMEWKDVSRSYFRIRHTGKSSKRLWYFENTTGKSLNFSTGMYSKASLQAIAEALVSKCQNAEIEQKIRDSAEGKFPWYIF